MAEKTKPEKGGDKGEKAKEEAPKVVLEERLEWILKRVLSSIADAKQADKLRKQFSEEDMT